MNNINWIYVMELAELEERLIHTGTFRLAGEIDGFVPFKSGFYCIKLCKESLLPERYHRILETRSNMLLL